MNIGSRLVKAAVDTFSGQRLKAVGALCVLLALGCWALASPVGASPDEDFHLTSIWCGVGLREGICEPGDTADSRRVPSPFPVDSWCYANHPDQSASCQQDSLEKYELASTDRGNFTGIYPPVFYAFNALFVGDSIVRSVLIMRLINAVLFIAFIAAVYYVLSPGLRRPMVLGAIVTSVPLGVFLVPSINPSGWAILSAITFLVCVLGFLTAEERRRRWTIGALAAISLLIGAGARADSGIYAVIAIAAAAILVARRDRATLRRLAYPAVLALSALVAFRLARQSQWAEWVQPPGTTTSFQRLWNTILDVPALWIGGVGSPPPMWDYLRPPLQGPWGLGWFDTGMPGVVWVGMWSIFAAVLFVSVSHVTRRRALVVFLIGAAAILIPTYMQLQTGSNVGPYVQPRYVLPLVIMLIIAAMVRLDGAAIQLTQSHRWIVVGVASVANSAALYANTRRYVTGINPEGWNLDRQAQWWWSLPITPLMVVAFGSLAFGIGLVLITREFVTSASASGKPSDVGDVVPVGVVASSGGMRDG